VFTKLLGLQYKIVYKKGADNRVADALSRKHFHESMCAAVSVVTPQWIKEVLASYEDEPSIPTQTLFYSLTIVVILFCLLSMGLRFISFVIRLFLSQMSAMRTQ
jgi:hypothetical protein